MLKRVFAIVITSFIAIASISVSGQTTIDELMQGANNNDEYSMFFLGYCYSVGEGITQNKEEARKWWEKLAEKTLTHKNKKYIAKAQWQLGNYYEEIRQIQKAMDWWNKAAKNGDATAKKKLDDYKSTPSILTHPDEEITANGVPFKMVFVRGGSFTMGGTAEQVGLDDDETPTHQVTLSDYFIGETEVTQELWYAVMGTNPSYFTQSSCNPVEGVSWNDCQSFIQKLNQLTGLRFRLPTEAEWEFAARGGTKSKGYKYSGSNRIDDVAWYDGNSGGATHEVATCYPNELGLYDMSGNVWEWCSDWYGSYSSMAQTDPFGADFGSYRVIRGGGWSSFAYDCRVSIRYNRTPSICGSYLGFRLVCSRL